MHLFTEFERESPFFEHCKTEKSLDGTIAQRPLNRFALIREPGCERDLIVCYKCFVLPRISGAV